MILPYAMKLNPGTDAARERKAASRRLRKKRRVASDNADIMTKPEQEPVSGPNRRLDEALRPDPKEGAQIQREEDVTTKREEDVTTRHEKDL